MAIRLSIHSQFTADFLYALNWADRLFAYLKPEALLMRPIPLRHPCIFYYGHLPAFAWNQIFRGALAVKPFNAEFDRLFERGIDPADDGSNGAGSSVNSPANWPPFESISAYKQQVETEIFSLLATNLDSSNTTLVQAIKLTIEHYLMHIETFIYMMHQLPGSVKRAPLRAMPNAASRTVSLRPERINIPAGSATLGRSRLSTDFSWCNECSEISASVEAFSIDKLPVTNEQFLEFVESGGYSDPSFWSEDGWAWIRRTHRSHPQFWVSIGDVWHYRGLFDVQPLPALAPVWVSLSEAQAFASWRGATLPTEEQYHRAAFGRCDGGENAFPWGDAPPSRDHGNFGLERFDPQPVGSHSAGDSAFGVQELVGNGWEWTRTIFKPFPGFTRIPSYPGYSSDFFDGHHFVLKGASPVTAGSLIRRSFRNWFQPHYPYVYAKFRCVYGSKD